MEKVLGNLFLGCYHRYMYFNDDTGWTIREIYINPKQKGCHD